LEVSKSIDLPYYSKKREVIRYILISGLLILCSALAVNAERLSFRMYTVADGLPSDDVNKIVADSRGFLWFCTVEGLSRFDGYRFKSYTTEQGLPHRNVHDLLETNEGEYVIATSNGLSMLNPTGTAYRWDTNENVLQQTSNDRPLFETFHIDPIGTAGTSRAVISLAKDGNGNLYAASNKAIHRVVKEGSSWTFHPITLESQAIKSAEINELFTDSRGDVWVAASTAIYRISKHGNIDKVLEAGGNTIFEDRQGRIWVDSGGNDIGIRVINVPSDGSMPVLAETFTTLDGIAENKFSNAVASTEDSRIFISSRTKLYEYIPDGSAGTTKRANFRILDNTAYRSATDRSGNVWFITPGRGVAKYSPNSFVTFDGRDGIPDALIRSITSNRSGEVFFVSGNQRLVQRDTNGSFTSIIPSGLDTRNWTNNFLDLQASSGEWWVPSTTGLRRYPKVKNFEDLAGTPPSFIYTEKDGLCSSSIFGIFEDSRRDIWISCNTESVTLARFNYSTQTFQRFTSEDGLPKANAPITFAEDAAGNVWISYFLGELYRYKQGTFRKFDESDGFPKQIVPSMLSDRNGRFWFATANRGLFHVDDPNSDTPIFSRFSTDNGLSSNRTLCLTMDALGRVYVGTGRGLNRLDADLSKVKLFSQADGLPGSIVSSCHEDALGKMWFSSNNSVIQFDSRSDPQSKPPPILIDALVVNGQARSVSELGETAIEKFDLSSNERQIQISFFAISLDKGESLRYQYKLSEQEWSPPDDQRTVSFNLSSGDYDFQVRAINSDGVVSETPATVAFRINPPFWRRWWFVTLAILFVGLIGFVVVRYRLTKIREVQTALEALNRSKAERLAELHRVRTRIATDLHDDIGSSLTQIAVLSEVARNEAATLASEGLSTKLESIKGVSRELVESMSDVVWAINPNKDTLSDLVQRMRRFGSDYCSARDIRFELDAPPSEEMIPLGANVRREIFAIFKEVVNNSVKYSECKRVTADFQIEDGSLQLKLTDDGKGFDTETTLSSDFSPDQGGNGLINIRHRASELGGECAIYSKIGGGTTVLLSIPLKLSEMDILAPAQSGGENDRQANV